MSQSLTRTPHADDFQRTALTHPSFNDTGKICAFDYDKDGFNAVNSALKYLEKITYWDEAFLGPSIPKLTFMTAYGILKALKPRYLMPQFVSPHDGGIMLKWQLIDTTILLGVEAATVRLTILEKDKKPFSISEQAFIDFIPEDIKNNLPLFVSHGQN